MKAIGSQGWHVFLWFFKPFFGRCCALIAADDELKEAKSEKRLVKKSGSGYN